MQLKNQQQPLEEELKLLNNLSSPIVLRNGEILARNFDSIKTFKVSILNFVRPRENVFAVHDINGLKLLTLLRLNFSHLNEHKF